MARIFSYDSQTVAGDCVFSEGAGSKRTDDQLDQLKRLVIDHRGRAYVTEVDAELSFKVS